MLLLLMRHGEAVEDAPGLGDAGRWLTAEGRATTRRVGHWLAQHAVPGAVFTSPLVRAVQTAEIVAGAVGLEEGLSVHPEIASGDLRGLTHKMASAQLPPGAPEALLVVGHEPTLSELVIRMLGGGDWRGFHKSAVCALTWDRKGGASFAWQLSPADLRRSTALSRPR